MRALAVVFAIGCAPADYVLAETAELDGEPLGVVMAPDGDLVVHHDSPDGFRFARFTQGVLSEVENGPAAVAPVMVAEGRLYIPQERGLRALEGGSESWNTSIPEGFGAVGPAAAVTPEGVVLLTSSEAGTSFLHGITRLGELRFTTELPGEAGAVMRTGGGLAFLEIRLGGGPNTYALDAADGRIEWSVSGATPVATVAEGVLLADTGLDLYDFDGNRQWSVAQGVSAGVAIAGNGAMWVAGSDTVSQVQMPDGILTTSFDRTCGGVTVGSDLAAWSLCTTGTGVALTRIGPTARSGSSGVAGVAVGSPVLIGGSAYATVGGVAPRLIRVLGAPAPASDAQWSASNGLGNTGRPDL